MKTHAKITPWIVGILLTSCMFAVFLGANMLLYSGSDDAPILRYYMGFEGGAPETFSMIIHPAMGWLLYGLSKLLPGAAWFSIFQLIFLWFSSVVVIKSLMQAAALRGRSPWIGAVLGMFTVAAGAFWISMRISFTTTAAWLGAAAVMQLASIDWAQGGKPGIRRGMALSIFLLICCYLLRQISVLPPLAFWLLGLLLVWLTHRKQAEQPMLRSILKGIAVCAVLLLVLTGARYAEQKILHVEDVYAWHDASGQLLDYSDVDHVSPTDDALSAIGWTRAEYKMFSYWYFLDDTMTVDAMNHLYESTFATDGQSNGTRLHRAFAMIRNTVLGTPSQACGILFALLATVLSLALAAMHGFRNPFVWLGALAVPLLGFVLLFYLGWEGRLPMRAMLSVTLPMITLSAWMLLYNLEPLPKAPVRSMAGLLLCLLLLYPAAQGVAHAWSESQKTLLAVQNELAVNETPVSEDLDVYAAENPDMLIVYDLTLVGDYRLFPRMPEELAGNALFWGGHSAHTPGWFRAFAKQGITKMDASLFLRDNVLLASTHAEPLPALLDYIRSGAEGAVDWMYYDSYGMINFFQFF